MSDDRQARLATRPVGRGETALAFVRRFSRLWGFALFLVFVVILFRQIVLPFVFAVLVAYLLAPSVRRLEPKLGRAGAVVLIYLGIVAALVAFFGLLLPAVVHDLARLRDAVPDLVTKINEDWLPRATAFVESTLGRSVPRPPDLPSDSSELVVVPQPDGSFRVDLERMRLRVHEVADGQWQVSSETSGGESPGVVLRELLAEQGGQLTGMLGRGLQALAGGVASFLTSFVLTFMIAGFLLVDLERVNGFVRSLVPENYRDGFEEIVRGMDVGMSGVVRGQLMICLVNGGLTYLGLLLIGVKYSLLLGLTAAVFSLVPIFGTIISSAPILGIALISDPSGALAFGKALGMLAWIAGIHLLEANYLNPKIIGTSAHIHPVIVVFALLAGESVYGLTGALLAVPAASVIQTVFLFARRRSAALLARSRAREAEDG
ncbi:MAG: AI-2E family transporter [Myxococcales bacterium FL481]|nr:MAG: AI-2E family transporter [Myxococcales bacterium FL481]